jgi:hypothetical protein
VWSHGVCNNHAMGKVRCCLLGDPGWIDRPSCGPGDVLRGVAWVLCGVVGKCGVVCGGGTRVMWRGARRRGGMGVLVASFPVSEREGGRKGRRERCVGVTVKVVEGRMGWAGQGREQMMRVQALNSGYLCLFVFHFWHMGNGFARLNVGSLVQGASGRLQRPAATLSSSQLQEPCISRPHIPPLQCASKRKLGTKCPIRSNQHHNAPPIRGIRGKTRSPQHPVNFSAP